MYGKSDHKKRMYYSVNNDEIVGSLFFKNDSLFQEQHKKKLHENELNLKRKISIFRREMNVFMIFG